MLKTYLYIPDELNKKIIATAADQRKSKAMVIRDALERGLAYQVENRNAGIEAFLELAEIGKENPFDGPTDSAERMNEYLWDKDWSNEE